MPAAPVHHTDVDKTGAWDGPAAEKKFDKKAGDFVKFYAWVDEGESDADADGTDKEDGWGPHHDVDSSGIPGAANLKGIEAAMAALNGAHGSTSRVPDSDRQAVWDHLAAHYEDAGVAKDDIPELKSALPPDVKKAARAKRAYAREERAVAMRPVAFSERRAADGSVSGYHLTGFASTTEEPYEMQDWAGPYTEVIRTGAFTKTLAEKSDVRLLENHGGSPLARTASGTLTLTEIAPGEGVEQSGLWCEADLDPSDPQVQSIAAKMRRGDLDQMSFAFRVVRQQWSPDFCQRDILEVELFDVSIVTYPANTTTSAQLRSAAAERVHGAVPSARLAAISAELREGKTLSADTMSVLQQVLDLVAAADDAVDEAQPLLADLMGVPNPDDDDETASEAEPGDDDPSGGTADPDDDGSEPRAAPLSLAYAQAIAEQCRRRALAVA